MAQSLENNLQALEALAGVMHRQSTPDHYAFAAQQLTLRFNQMCAAENAPKNALQEKFTDIAIQAVDHIDENPASEALNEYSKFILIRTRAVVSLLQTLLEASSDQPGVQKLRDAFVKKAEAIDKNAYSEKTRAAIVSAQARLILEGADPTSDIYKSANAKMSDPSATKAF